VSTKPDNIKHLENLRSRFEIKARLLSILRVFFESEGFLEVFTPVRVKAPAPEEHIEAVKSDGMFLRTSPELEMKRLLAAGYERIYQIGPCFRAGERGRLHREEFLMLEWYQAGIDCMELLDFMRSMLTFCAKRMPESNIDFSGEWIVYTVDEAFRKFAGVSVFDALKNDEFEELLVTKVEPSLPIDKPVVLKEYPAEQASLARLKTDDPKVADRWELYLGGVEIANVFGELVDAK
jgi:lysyl-tRNA synthetase class 2